MLVLSRYRDESIIIGDNIVITVVEIRGDKVRIGIQAPTEVPIHRAEVYELIQRENNGIGTSGGLEIEINVSNPTTAISTIVLVSPTLITVISLISDCPSITLTVTVSGTIIIFVFAAEVGDFSVPPPLPELLDTIVVIPLDEVI